MSGYHGDRRVAGVGPLHDEDMPSHWNSYVAVQDADATADRVKNCGGTVVAGPMQVMEEGRMAVFQGPDGAYASIWQAYFSPLAASVLTQAATVSPSRKRGTRPFVVMTAW